jgi:chemotaxis protein MotB
MPREARILAATITGLLVIALLAVALWRRNAALRAMDAALGRARAETQLAFAAASSNLNLWAASTSVVAAAQSRIQVLEQEKTDLAREKEAIAERQRTLETEMRQAIESKDITISELQGRLTVDILDRVLFDSGEATLKTEGEAVLQRVAGVLAQFANRQIHVIGHTDNVPIRAGARVRFASNWELSAARAIAAVRFLSEQAGVDARRLGALGYGEFRPVADNATAEGRARNRRIALVVLSEELAGSDAAATARLSVPPAPAETNAAAPAVLEPSEPLPHAP